MTKLRLLCAMLLLCVVAGLLTSCPPSGRYLYNQGLAHFNAQQYQDALNKFDEALAAEPTSKVITFYRARALFELDRHDEALKAFEKFLDMSKQEITTYGDDRDTAEFFIIKCKQELGMPVEQSPEDIPEERMRY